MASWSKQPGGAWKLRWRHPTGQARSQTFPAATPAGKRRQIQAGVEILAAQGRDWRDATEGARTPLLSEALDAWIRDRRVNGVADSTLRSLADTAAALRRFLGDGPVSRLGPESFTAWREDYATRRSLHGRPRAASTVAQAAGQVLQFWRFAAWLHPTHVHAPAPTTRVVAPPPEITTAPTWEQADAFLHQLRTPGTPAAHYRAAMICRCAGIRESQAIRLLWPDLDLDRGVLTVRPELGKTRQEKRGRRVPIAPVLAAELRTWPKHSFVVVDAGLGTVEGQALRAAARRAWGRAGIPKAVWGQRPIHCLRKGFVTGLMRAGADTWAVEYLVGHGLGGVRDAYEAMDEDPRCRAAVLLVPPVGGPYLTARADHG